MNEIEFIQKFEAEIPIYKNWAKIINNVVMKELGKKLNNINAVQYFLRIPPIPRIKSNKSIIEKAFYRPGKNYSSPYDEITDKVGIRYVVLLNEDISLIREIIEETKIWTFSKDRDFEQDKNNHPFEFDYQSLHYILRNQCIMKSNNISIPINTPCEIQVRTLLQHAHCELTHDTTYKPNFRNLPDVKRSIAKSLALIEATGDIFTTVDRQFKEKRQIMDTVFSELKELYNPIDTKGFETKVNENIIDAFSNNLLQNFKIDDLSFYLGQNPWIFEKITLQRQVYFLYSQPIVLLLFYFAKKYPKSIKKFWPLPNEKLEPIFSDLGIQFDNK